MNKGRKRHNHAGQTRARAPSQQSIEAVPTKEAPARDSRRRVARLAILGLFIVVAMSGAAVWKGCSDSVNIVHSNDPTIAISTHVDEARIREVCSHCHQYPSPDILPRRVWRETIWDMFRESGYGTTVKWRVDPESVVAWYEERAPERFEFPKIQQDVAASSVLAIVKRPIATQTIEPAPTVSNILVADVVGDEQRETIVCDMLNGQILMGQPGEPNWKLEPIGSVDHPAHVEAVDLNLDGRTDLVVANLGSFLALDHNLGSVEWLRQSADGSFERTTLAAGFGRVADVQPDDFDQDGDVDLLVAEFGWRTTGHLRLLENRTQPGQAMTFTNREIDGLHGASHVDVTDLDGDGLRDIIVLYSQGHEMVRCYLQREGFIFSIHDLYRAPNPGWGFSGSQLVDLDNDDDLDILLSNGDTFDNSVLKPYHGVQWLENKGNLKFEPHDLGTLYGAYRAEAGDMDGDGDMDVVACALIAPGTSATSQLGNDLESIVWFEQDSRGHFVRRTLESNQCHHPTLTLGDYDRDGDVDLFVGNGQLHLTVVPSGRSCMDLWENQTIRPADTP